MKAKDLYRALEEQLGPWFKAHGFKKRRASRLTFQRVIGDKHHSIWFQCDKYGWDTYAGGKFFVNFTVSESPDVEDGSRREERLNYFLTDAELVRARDYRDGLSSESRNRRARTSRLWRRGSANQSAQSLPHRCW